MSNTYLYTLVEPLKMLSSMAVAYGNADRFEMSFCGNQQEILKNDQAFVESPIPLSKDSIFDIASLTKLFTCISILKLMESRLISMSDTVGAIDRRFKNLRHTSLFDVLTYRAYLKSPKRIDEAKSIEEAEAQVFSTYQSHEKPVKLYSDMNALVLKYIIETLSGNSYDDFLNKEIFNPLGMFNTFGFVPKEKIKFCVNYNYEHKILNGEYYINTQVPLGVPHDPKANVLRKENNAISGHAGIFSTIGDMALFCTALLRGKIIKHETLRLIGIPHTGFIKASGQYQQYMGLLCFSKSKVKRFSEVPPWMHSTAFALSGYTGCHIAIDPILGVFEVMLGNRCHNRVSFIVPENSRPAATLSEDSSGRIKWENGRQVCSSVRYVYNKDSLLHGPVYNRLVDLGILQERGAMRE
ncbi:MAG: serine hydrolase [Eubacteriales bacterium]|nr:serine hydrolase [Eubacteriales bacterium]